MEKIKYNFSEALRRIFIIHRLDNYLSLALIDPSEYLISKRKFAIEVNSKHNWHCLAASL